MKHRPPQEPFLTFILKPAALALVTLTTGCRVLPVQDGPVLACEDWDADGDVRISLADIVHALKKLAGLRP